MICITISIMIKIQKNMYQIIIKKYYLNYSIILNINQNYKLYSIKTPAILLDFCLNDRTMF